MVGCSKCSSKISPPKFFLRISYVGSVRWLVQVPFQSVLMSEKIDVDSPVVQSHVVLLCPHAPSSTETASRNLGREDILIPSTLDKFIFISQCSVRSIFLEVSGSNYYFFPRPQRRLTGSSWVVIQFRVQRSCKTVTSITEQSMKSPTTSSTRAFSSRWT